MPAIQRSGDESHQQTKKSLLPTQRRGRTGIGQHESDKHHKRYGVKTFIHRLERHHRVVSDDPNILSHKVPGNKNKRYDPPFHAHQYRSGQDQNNPPHPPGITQLPENHMRLRIKEKQCHHQSEIGWIEKMVPLSSHEMLLNQCQSDHRPIYPSLRSRHHQQHTQCCRSGRIRDIRHTPMLIIDQHMF